MLSTAVNTTQYKIAVSFQEQKPRTLVTGYCTKCTTYGDNVLYYTYKWWCRCSLLHIQVIITMSSTMCTTDGDNTSSAAHKIQLMGKMNHLQQVKYNWWRQGVLFYNFKQSLMLPRRTRTCRPRPAGSHITQSMRSGYSLAAPPLNKSWTSA